MLAKLDEVLDGTLTNEYAIPAFNVFGYEDARAVVAAAEEISAPVILATNKVAIEYIPIEILGKILISIAEKATVPVVVHLDHGKDFSTIAQAIKSGYSSVMYDGSHLPLEINIHKTKEIVKLAHAFEIPVEAEIGSVGYSGDHEKPGVLTNPQEAKLFAEETKVDALAVAVGTVHRMEQQSAFLQFDRIEEIQKLVSVPLVMHGSTGIPDEDLGRVAKTNFGKVNIGTAIRMAFGKKLKEQCLSDEHTFDRVKLFQEPIEAVKREALHKMKQLHLENYRMTKTILNQ